MSALTLLAMDESASSVSVTTHGDPRSIETVVFIGRAASAWGDLPHQVGRFTRAVVIDLRDVAEPMLALEAALQTETARVHLVVNQPAEQVGTAWAGGHPAAHASTILVDSNAEPAEVLELLQTRVVID